MLKKRCRKVRSRMNTRAEEFCKSYNTPSSRDSPAKQKIKRSIAQVTKLLSGQGTGPWPTNEVSVLDRNLLEILRILDTDAAEEQQRIIFASLNGFKRLWPLLSLIRSNGGECVLPVKSMTYCIRVLLAGCRNSKDNCQFLVNSNLAADIIEWIVEKFDEMNEESLSTPGQPSDATVASLRELLAEIFRVLTNTLKEKKDDTLDLRIQDLVSYCVSIGVTDKISWFFNHIQCPIDNDPPSSQVVMAAMSLLSSLAGTIHKK